MQKGDMNKSCNSATDSIEFFRFEFYRIYKIYRKPFLVVLKMKIAKNSLLQILLIL